MRSFAHDGPLIYFTDVFGVDPEELKSYGAFNVSLINDLPLFIDPFLLFHSEKPDYRALHDDGIIRYLRFLRDKSLAGKVSTGLLEAWFTFREVKQNWLGFSKTGNRGSGLYMDFARALNRNLNTVFRSFGEEQITAGTHLEKLCLIRDGVGRDNISDFTTNLIKRFLLDYTQEFARRALRAEQIRPFVVEKVEFNYESESWQRGTYALPVCREDFVLLTPKDILTKDETWIHRAGLIDGFETVAAALPDTALRAQVDNHLRRQLHRDPKPKEIREAKARTIEAFPVLIEHYIKSKEEDGDRARSVSGEKVRESEQLFIDQVKALVRTLNHSTGFYGIRGGTYEEARRRVEFLKDVIENKDGYRLFYLKGQPIAREDQLQILYRLTWFGTVSDVNREVNCGRGPVDFAVSRGAADKSLVEFKLASNKKLKRNLQNQIEIYRKAADAQKTLKVIIYFRQSEYARVRRILHELQVTEDPDIFLVDARRDNKPSASNV